MKDYTNETKKFIPKNITLLIYCDGLVTSKVEAKAMLVECIKLYMALPYKHRIFIKSKSATCNIMIKNAMKDGGMSYGIDGIILDDIKSVDEYIKEKIC